MEVGGKFVLAQPGLPTEKSDLLSSCHRFRLPQVFVYGEHRGAGTGLCDKVCDTDGFRMGDAWLDSPPVPGKWSVPTVMRERWPSSGVWVLGR